MSPEDAAARYTELKCAAFEAQEPVQAAVEQRDFAALKAAAGPAADAFEEAANAYKDSDEGWPTSIRVDLEIVSDWLMRQAEAYRIFSEADSLEEANQAGAVSPDPTAQNEAHNRIEQELDFDMTCG